MTSLRFAVVGAGRLGASLALALKAKGLRLAGYTSATQSGRLSAQALLGGAASATLKDLVSQKPDLYLITVPDSVVAKVASELAGLLDTDQQCWVAHTSGSTSVDALHSCALAGATTFKFHPLQTFADASSGSERFAAIAVAVTPDTPAESSPGAQMGFALADLLEARPFLLSDGDRVIYHAAATIACNYLVTLEHVARRLFVDAGMPEDDAFDLFLPLVRTTLANLASFGSVDALTGPLSRGDDATITDHLAALAGNYSTLLPLYQELGLATLELVRARGELDESRIRELTGLLTRPQEDLAGTPS